MFKVNKAPTTSVLHRFGWAMLGGFGVIGAGLWFASGLGRGDAAGSAWSASGAQIAAMVLVVLGVLLFALSRAAPPIARRVYIVWMSVAMPIGIVMTVVLLTALFVVLLPVFCLVVRAGDPLRRRLTTDQTYWEGYKPYENTLDRMERPF